MEIARRIYGVVAILGLNILLIIGAVSLAFSISARIKRHFAAPAAPPFFRPDGSPTASRELPAGAYDSFDYGAETEIPPAEAYETLAEAYRFTNGGLTYRPWVGFTEQPFEGKHIHLVEDPIGFSFRRTTGSETDPARKAYTVFTFGGSTTFGYPVSDEHTWPSFLAAALRKKFGGPVRVINFGHCGYYSSQETALALRALKLGMRPDLMIFLDGINEDGRNWGESQRGDEPENTTALAFAYRLLQDQTVAGDLDRARLALGNNPLFRFVPGLLASHKMGPLAIRPEQQDNEAIGDRMFERYHANQLIATAAARAFGVKTLFFLQPDALDNYPTALYPHPVSADYTLERRKHARFFARARAFPDLHSLAGLFAEWGEGRKALVDQVHYSPAFGRFLAERIAGFIPAAPPR